MFGVVQIVCVVNNAFDVALIVANHHSCGEYIFHNGCKDKAFSVLFSVFYAKRFVLSSQQFFSPVYALVVLGMTGRFLKGGLLACKRTLFTR